MSEKIVVLGSNSFSGAHFVRHALLAGCEVIGISRSPEPPAVFLPYKWKPATPLHLRFFQFDLNHHLPEIMRIVKDFRPDYFVNFAAQGMVAESWRHPQDWFRTNTLANVCLHDQLRQCAFLKRYLHVSTPEVYGNCEGLVAEHSVYHPSTPYAVSRAAADMSLMSFHKMYHFPVLFTRSANVFGPGQQLYRIVPRAILAFLTGKKLPLHGGGQAVRSFIFITDVAEATLRALRRGAPPDIFHLATKRNISIRELVQLIANLLGVDFEACVEATAERPGKDQAYLLESSHARQMLDWHDQVSLEQGIEQTAAWVRRNLAELTRYPQDYIHKP